MSPKQDDSGWTEPKATALLVLADGTVLEGMPDAFAKPPRERWSYGRGRFIDRHTGVRY